MARGSVCPVSYTHLDVYRRQVCEFCRTGCSCLYSFLTLQSFFLKKVKRIFHFFQAFNRKISSFLGFIDFITPILAFIFIKQIIVVFSGSFIKLPFVLKCLCFTALITAQFITLAFCQKIFSTDFAPVSYTHLDVYKRQPQPSWLSLPWIPPMGKTSVIMQWKPVANGELVQRRKIMVS